VVLLRVKRYIIRYEHDTTRRYSKQTTIDFCNVKVKSVYFMYDWALELFLLYCII